MVMLREKGKKMVKKIAGQCNQTICNLFLRLEGGGVGGGDKRSFRFSENFFFMEFNFVYNCQYVNKEKF